MLPGRDVKVLPFAVLFHYLNFGQLSYVPAVNVNPYMLILYTIKEANSKDNESYKYLLEQLFFRLIL